MDTNVFIDNAKQRFNSDLHTNNYDFVHFDSEQINKLISLINIFEGKKYLDLATGTGYVGFQIAESNPSSFVVGLDIADKAIEKNIIKKKQKGIKNIEFLDYDGIIMPFKDFDFDGVICRYGLHHFPNLELSINEIKRVLKPGGNLVISDIVVKDCDDINFINKFQELKNDDHVRCYKCNELIKIFEARGFNHLENFISKITFSRKLTTEYNKLLESVPPQLKESYDIFINNEEVFISMDVINVSFIKA